jgi:Ca2+-binding EF-hand superfamily protein
VEPLPLKAEILVPACPPQSVMFDPADEKIDVDFGRMKVMLQQKEAKDNQKAPLDIASTAEAKNLPAEKLSTAQKAASYLEKHDLVRTFQDILHGLLLTTPEDPHAYVEERLARSKKMATKKREADSGNPAPRRGGVNGRASVRQTMRGTVGSRNKVDTMLMTLSHCRENLPLILPLLPADLQAQLESPHLITECDQQFKLLDTKKQSRLDPEDLLPVVCQLSGGSATSIGTDQCRQFVSMFDIDDDGMVDANEFVLLVQFVMVAAFLESEEGHATLEHAHIEEKNFDAFLNLVQDDRERLWALIPFLPEWLVGHLTSEEFQISCNQHFDALDVDKSGDLEPLELVSIVQSLSQAHPLTIDYDKCRKFTAVFDVYGNGVIMRDEFVEFAQFLTVMNFLSTTAEGQALRQDMETTDHDKIANLIAELEAGKDHLADVLHALPAAFVNEITSEGFTKTCLDSFTELDKDGNGVLDPSELFAVIITLAEVKPYHMDMAHCQKFTELFDKDKNGVVSKAEFVELARFITVMSYLDYALAHEEMLAAEVYLGEEKIMKLLDFIHDGVSQLQEIVPFLPPDLIEEMQSPEFIAQCTKDFAQLDADKSGVLEPKELIPVILHLSEAHHFCLTQAHCQHFVDLFDTGGNGVITGEEYINFARFMLVMAFLDTDEGWIMQYDMEVAQRQANKDVESVLRMLEQDRKAVHKVLPLLPGELFDELSSDAFVMSCHDHFAELDQMGNGALAPQELIPVIAEMTGSMSCHINAEQCKQFVKIFDLYGDGCLRPDEFLDFSRFLCIMSFIQTEEGKAACQEAMRVMDDSKKVDELIKTMQQDRKQIHQVIPYLPDSLRDDLTSDHFTVECLAFFKELDKDGNGSLDPVELYPMVQSLSNAHESSLDLDQCRQFMAIFDDAKTGVISVEEFVNFARFLIVMAWLRSHEGQEVMALASSDPAPSRRPEAPVAPSPEHTLPPPPAPTKDETFMPDAHLAVDCEFYREKAEKAAAENETLRGRLSGMEQLVRTLQDKLEEQERRLRHAQVDLRNTGSQRL